jgi:flavin-dependent dehydrogenase
VSISASVGLGEAARRLWDVVVVGAGPAGALAAYALARARLAVLLLDRAAFPRYKVCGCCLNGRAQACLADAGLRDLPRRLGAAPLDRLLLAGGGREACIGLRGERVLSREALDAGLAAAAVDAGATFVPETFAARGPCRSAARAVLLRQGRRAETVWGRLVLAADGLAGTFSADRSRRRAVGAGSWIGAGAVADAFSSFYAAGTVYMACGRGGYVGLVRREDGRLDVAAALDPAPLGPTRAPGAAAARILAETGWPPLTELARLSWRGTPALSHRARHLARKRLFVIGDAASFVQPFTGEGIAWALQSARSVVPLAVQAVACWEPHLVRAWADRYRRTVLRRQWACRALSAALRRPNLTAAGIALLARLPALARPVLRATEAPGARGDKGSARGGDRA